MFKIIVKYAKLNNIKLKEYKNKIFLILIIS